jgi:hypothetical protein
MNMIEEERGISIHRQQIVIQDLKDLIYVPKGKLKWNLRRFALEDDQYIYCCPIFPGVWTWESKEWYEDKCIKDCIKAIRATGKGRIKYEDLLPVVPLPPGVKCSSLRVFLRKFPERIHVYTDIGIDEMWILECNKERQMPTFTTQNVTIGHVSLYEPLEFDWDEYADVDPDLVRIELDFIIPDKIYEIAILSCADLKRADIIGSSDPVGIVYFDGVEIGRTSMLKNTLFPEWREAIFVVSIPVVVELMVFIRFIYNIYLFLK